AVACADIRFTAVGLVWRQEGSQEVAAGLAVGPRPDRVGPVTTVEASPQEGPDPGTPEFHPDLRATDLLWVGTRADARCARFRLTLPGGVEVQDLRVVLLNTSGTARGPATGGAADPTEPGAAPAGAPLGGGGLGASPAEAMTRRPGIVTRSQWGARESLRNCGPSYAPAVKVAFVHHTAYANGYSPAESDDVVRAIYRYHTGTLGWCDIAYNFLVDRYGVVFEGRYGGIDQPVVPAATMGFNSGSTAVAAIGNFEYAPVPDAVVRAIVRLLAWRLDVAHVHPQAYVWRRSGGSTGGKYPAGTWVRFPTIAAHRDAGFTACPGDFLYARLRTIREAVFGRGLPKIFWPTQSRARLVPTQDQVTWSAGASAELEWRLELRDEAGSVVRTWRATGQGFSLTWDGLDSQGQPQSPGAYDVKLWGRTSTGRARAAWFELQVAPVPSPTPSPTPSPSLSPSPSPTPSPAASPTG
ncbi:MAG TPA: N-acetylmuramoyl-L-alanine amidase, partial [Actinomycetota bacterium]|nr:N-acetylmuramoyl-L-alanine amidase [Actinomycetota bacterium]